MGKTYKRNSDINHFGGRAINTFKKSKKFKKLNKVKKKNKKPVVDIPPVITELDNYFDS
jgi:hypothetical protein